MERNMLTDQEAKELGSAIGSLVMGRGLGAISKKDYELLVFHHICKSRKLRGKGNYDLANELKVTESRVKALRLESSIRHAPANHRAVLGEIVNRIIEKLSQPEFSGEEVSITLEDPIEKREFEHAVKKAKHNVEYGINREILKISPLALFEVILSNLEDPESCFKEIVQTNITVKKKQREILDRSLTLRQKVNKFGKEVTVNNGAVAMLSSAVALL